MQAEVAAHPLFWPDVHRIDKIRGWKSSWCRGAGLDRRLHAHSGSVRQLLGGAGWLVALDPVVVARLGEGGRSYNGTRISMHAPRLAPEPPGSCERESSH